VQSGAKNMEEIRKCMEEYRNEGMEEEAYGRGKMEV
jgi:hypothetical protein